MTPRPNLKAGVKTLQYSIKGVILRNMILIIYWPNSKNIYKRLKNFTRITDDYVCNHRNSGIGLLLQVANGVSKYM